MGAVLRREHSYIRSSSSSFNLGSGYPVPSFDEHGFVSNDERSLTRNYADDWEIDPSELDFPEPILISRDDWEIDPAQLDFPEPTRISGFWVHLQSITDVK